MNRDELIEAGTRALWSANVAALLSDCEWRAGIVLDAIEPLIRADERERWDAGGAAVLTTLALADLRAKVEALAAVNVDDYLYIGMVWYQDVLDLLDGAER